MNRQNTITRLETTMLERANMKTSSVWCGPRHIEPSHITLDGMRSQLKCRLASDSIAPLYGHSGLSRPIMVGSNSETVGWMNIARCRTV